MPSVEPWDTTLHPPLTTRQLAALFDVDYRTAGRWATKLQPDLFVWFMGGRERLFHPVYTNLLVEVYFRGGDPQEIRPRLVADGILPA